MATRKKIFYTENEIKRDLYTNGLVLMTADTWTSYVGPYHYYESTGEIFSEFDWHPTKSKKLIPYVGGKSTSYFKYMDLVHYTTVKGQKEPLIGPIRIDKFSGPIEYMVMPSEKEKLEGVMVRYFVFKRNEKTTRLPIEIDRNQAENYNRSNRGINQLLYELVEMPWKLTGPEYDVVESGIVKTPGVFDTNKRIVEKYSKKFPILMKKVTNYLEFSIYDR